MKMKLNVVVHYTTFTSCYLLGYKSIPDSKTLLTMIPFIVPCDK